MIDRCDETLLGKHILRLEAELKRPVLKKHLGKTAMETNYKILSSAAKTAPKVIQWYMDRLQPKGEIVRYKDAVELINSNEMKTKTRDRILYLLRKTSDSENLSAALKKMQKKYRLTNSQCNTVLKKINKLGISPITLRNDSDFNVLPFILYYIER